MAKTLGLSLLEIESLSLNKFNQLYLATQRLEAEDKLTQLNVIDYPRMKKDDRKKLYDAYKKIAYPNDERKVQTMDALARFQG